MAVKSENRANTPRRWPLRAALLLLLLAVGGFTYWTIQCPCERVPGFVLFGEQAPEPVSDWRFANDVPLCQIQIAAGWRPHAINLNCMATDAGELFLSCSVCETKYWAGEVEFNERGRLRLNGVVYPVILNRVADPETKDRAWAARVQKLQRFGGAPYNPTPAQDAPRPDHWWTFTVQSAAAG